MRTQISVEDASLQLGISQQQVRTLCRQAKITAKKIGNTWIVDQKSVNQYELLFVHKTIEDRPVYQTDIQEKRKPIALSFFSGAMGLDLGIEKAGFDLRLACESDKFCRQTITLNRPNTALIGNINDYEPEDILKAAQLKHNDDIDLIVGGPPCQAFSTAGKRKAFNDLHLIINILKQFGYAYSFNLYNAANFGTPQTRERVIIICSRDGKTPPFLVPTHAENGEYGLPKWKSLRSCLQNIKKHDHLNFPEKRLQYYKILKSGENWRNLPTELQKVAMGKSYYLGGGKTGFLRRLAWDRPSPTLVTHPAMPTTDLAHPGENRPLSIQEYKRIQEFPDNWLLAGSLIQQYKQVGNAVPVSLGFAVGNLILNLINGIKVVQFDNFEFSHYGNTNHITWEKQFLKQLENKKKSFTQQELIFH
jgi:DNA (cytosine-5)-methyltransferase 1